MSKIVKIKVKKIAKKTAVKKPKKAVVKRKAVKTGVKPRKVKPAAAEKKRITHEDIEKKIDEIDIEGIIKKERDKRMILWAGVSFFMVLIFAFWIFNLKQTFKQIESENTGGEDFEWSKITDDFSKTMGEMKKNIAEIKKFTDTAENYETSTSTAIKVSTSTEDKIISTSTSAQQGDLGELEELKAKLEELEKKLNMDIE